MKFFWITLILLFSLFLETTLFPLPFVLLNIFLLAVLFQEQWIFLFAFLIGFLLDILTFHSLGVSSLFFLCMLGIVFLYQRKYEIQSMLFIVVFSFLASGIYAFFFLQYAVIFDAFFTALLGGGVFYILSSLNTNHTRTLQFLKR